MKKGGRERKRGRRGREGGKERGRKEGREREEKREGRRERGRERERGRKGGRVCHWVRSCLSYQPLVSHHRGAKSSCTSISHNSTSHNKQHTMVKNTK